MRMWVRAAVACATAVAVALSLASLPAATTAAGPSCSVGARAMPGAGKLEWKRSARSPVRTRGIPALPYVRTGNALLVNGVTAIAGRSRHQIAAIDVRTGKPLPFDAPIPANAVIKTFGASPTAVYVVFESEDQDGALHHQVKAYDLATGAPLAGFASPDFQDGLIEAVTYAAGRLVVAGGPAVGPGPTLAAYDPATGATAWRNATGWPIHTVVSDGARLYVGVAEDLPEEHVLAAFDAATGQRIAGWGSSIPPNRRRGMVVGLDPSRVFGGVVTARPGTRPLLAVTRAEGRPTRPPRLPSNTVELLSGTGRTILGRIRVPTHTGPAILIGAVFDTTGKLIGTVCSRYHVLAQRDDRRLVAVELLGQSSARIVELVRPRR
jgi:hypothetical protein